MRALKNKQKKPFYFGRTEAKSTSPVNLAGYVSKSLDWKFLGKFYDTLHTPEWWDCRVF